MRGLLLECAAEVVVREGLRRLVADVEILVEVRADGSAAGVAGGDTLRLVIPPEERRLSFLEANGDF